MSGAADSDPPAAPDSFVHRWEPAVPGASGRSVLVLLHGTGGDENDLLPLGRALDERAALLAPRGRVLEHGMPRFFRRIGEGVFDLDDLARRTVELAGFIGDAARAYGFDPRRVIAVGFSNGANIGASLLLSRPASLAGAILLSPMLPYDPGVPPDLARRPVFIGAGRHDSIAPPAQVERLERVLTNAGASVTTHWTAAGHTVTPDEVAAARSWLAERSAED